MLNDAGRRRRDARPVEDHVGDLSAFRTFVTIACEMQFTCKMNAQDFEKQSILPKNI